MPVLQLNKHRDRLDKLSGSKLTVGLHKVKVLEKIGEGGSSFVYLASISTNYESKTPTAELEDQLSSVNTKSNDGYPSLSTMSSQEVKCAHLPDGGTTRTNDQSEEKNTNTMGASIKWNVFKKINKSTKRRNLAVLKSTSVDSSHKCKQSLMEVDILRTLSAHANIISFIDSGFSVSHNPAQVRELIASSNDNKTNNDKNKDENGNTTNNGETKNVFNQRLNVKRVHHILLEHCAGGTLMNFIWNRRKNMRVHTKKNTTQFDHHHNCLFNIHSPRIVDEVEAIIGFDSENTGTSSSTSKSQLNLGSNSHMKYNYHSSHVRAQSTDRASKSLRGVAKINQQNSEDDSNISDVSQSGYLDLFDILAIFRQIVDAVSFMHNRGDGMAIDHHTNSSSKNIDEFDCTRKRPPIIHRDLKPENILLVHDPVEFMNSPTKLLNENGDIDEFINYKQKQWQIKICDFGSAIIGRTPLTNPQEREAANESIKRSTTQMYRAPEMVDLHLSEELNEKTDVWALGCTLYSTCFLRNCFEVNENLSILSGDYKIPESHPYNDNLVELIHRMLKVDSKERACINEVSACIDALQRNEDLPKSEEKSRRVNLNTSHITPFWNEELFNMANTKKFQRSIPTYIHTSFEGQRKIVTSPLPSPSTFHESSRSSTNSQNILKERSKVSSNLKLSVQKSVNNRIKNKGKMRLNAGENCQKNSTGGKMKDKTKQSLAKRDLVISTKVNQENVPLSTSSFLTRAIDYELAEERVLMNRSSNKATNKLTSTPVHDTRNPGYKAGKSSFFSPASNCSSSTSHFSPALSVSPLHDAVDKNVQEHFRTTRDGFGEFTRCKTLKESDSITSKKKSRKNLLIEIDQMPKGMSNMTLDNSQLIPDCYEL